MVSDAKLAVKKLGVFDLPSNRDANIQFGQQLDFLIIFKDEPSQVYYYTWLESNTFELKWKKPLPSQHSWSCWMNISLEGNIYLQTTDIIAEYSPNLEWIKNLEGSGVMVGLSSTNVCIKDSFQSGHNTNDDLVVSVTISPDSNSKRTELSRSYKRENPLGACSLADRSVVIVDTEQNTIDFFQLQGMTINVTDIVYRALFNSQLCPEF